MGVTRYPSDFVNQLLTAGVTWSHFLHEGFCGTLAAQLGIEDKQRHLMNSVGEIVKGDKTSMFSQ
jgi:hypothetical protein